MADCRAVTLAKDLLGTGQTSARKGFCHDEVQGLGTAGWWDGQAARMDGGTHERWGVSVWGGIRTGRQVRTMWGAAHRWGMGATAAASTRVRGGHGDGAAWTAVVVGKGQVGGQLGGRHMGWKACTVEAVARPGEAVMRPTAHTS